MKVLLILLPLVAFTFEARAQTDAPATRQIRSFDYPFGTEFLYVQSDNIDVEHFIKFKLDAAENGQYITREVALTPDEADALPKLNPDLANEESMSLKKLIETRKTTGDKELEERKISVAEVMARYELATFCTSELAEKYLKAQAEKKLKALKAELVEGDPEPKVSYTLVKDPEEGQGLAYNAIGVGATTFNSRVFGETAHACKLSYKNDQDQTTYITWFIDRAFGKWMEENSESPIGLWSIIRHEQK